MVRRLNVVSREPPGGLKFVDHLLGERHVDCGNICADANCDSVTRLRRDAYIGRALQTIGAYGSRWNEPPIYYSLFAYESDSMYAAELNELLSSHALQDRIGSVCYCSTSG